MIAYVASRQTSHAIYLLRGVIVACVAEWILEQVTGYPSYSASILYGVFLAVPASGPLYIYRGLALAVAVTLAHLAHTVLAHSYYSSMEFLVLLASSSTILWWNTIERWGRVEG